jgi:hypothetical protein
MHMASVTRNKQQFHMISVLEQLVLAVHQQPQSELAASKQLPGQVL